MVCLWASGTIGNAIMTLVLSLRSGLKFGKVNLINSSDFCFISNKPGRQGWFHFKIGILCAWKTLTNHLHKRITTWADNTDQLLHSLKLPVF